MIAAKIPAAIRACSPVYMETPHGDMVTGIAARLQPENGTICVFASDEDIWNVPADLVSLVISDPTGAAHLAWWLRSLPGRDAETCRADFIAIGCAPALIVAAMKAVVYAVECAASGLPVGDDGLTLLRDYAHRVAGVTNG